MRKTKIVHVIGSLSRGGAERLVVDLCNELSRSASLEVVIISLKSNEAGKSFVSEIGQAVRYVTFNKGAGFSWQALWSLTAWLRREQPDVVHSHLNAFEYLYPYVLLNRRSSCVHTVHNIAPEECPSMPVKTLRSLFYRWGSVKPITISLDGRISFRSYYGLANDWLIENGCKPATAGQAVSEKYRRASGTKVLLHVARVSPEKNQEMLIRVVRRFNQEETTCCRLLMIGEVHDLALANKLKTLAAGDVHIEFLGGRSDVADYLAVADIFCLPSLFEGMPISLLEAMSAGCIPVCTPAGGMGDVIDHGFNGFLSDGLDEHAYYQALKTAVYSKDTEQLSARARATFATKYHISIAAQKHKALYQTLASPEPGQVQQTIQPENSI
ncbi:glycosyltransferase family 4 protein [Pedobacter yulinensis]|nr:glycosyltransferase family 4 protein [Pedobacter yulinensis]